MTHLLTSEIAHHGYLAVFLLMVLESACIPIPSEVVMPFGGALAGGLLASAGHPHVGLLGIGLAGVAGNLLGSLVAYAVGRRGGRPLLERYGHLVHLQPAHLHRAEEFFARRGPASVLVARVLPVVRTFISLPAGVAEMPAGRFGLYTLLGSLPWCFALAGAGDALVGHWSRLASAVSASSIVIVVPIVVLAAAVWYRTRRRSARPAAD